MKKIFLVYGHYNKNSFNAAIKNEFIKQSELKGNKVDVVDLYKEKFDPVFAGEEPSAEVLDHLGDCYFMLNRKKEAVFEWNKALKYETDKNKIKKIKEKIRKHQHLL